jgi:hypothetical protein
MLACLQTDLGRIATVSYRNDLAIVSLICNVQRTSNILEKVGGASFAACCGQAEGALGKAVTTVVFLHVLNMVF